jgi:predicted  nucleic acid-binding Zn-ribbon protein
MWKLHQLDSSILEIRNRAAALDAGKSIQSEIAKIEAEYKQVGGNAKALSAEQTDIELKQRSLGEKLVKIDKELYGGKVVNPREVEALQKEIGILKKQRSDLDGRLLELWEEVPPAKKAAEEIEARLNIKKKELEEYQKKVLEFKVKLEKEFKERSAMRPALAKEIPPAMLSRYELVRQKYGGVGMAEVLKGNTCSACGTLLPEKLVEGAREGKLVTCESCHRLLYAPDGLI